MNEAEKPIEDYKCIADLFTRQLRPGARPVKGPLVHPVDAALNSVQTIRGDQVLQAKGIQYKLTDFLDNPNADKKFKSGKLLTYYLCPTDYHRVHSPCDAQITEVQHIPGRLWPVNHWSVHFIKRLFAINERVVIWMNTEWGQIAYVMVGATNVGKMTLAFDPTLVTNCDPFFPKRSVKTYRNLHVKAGDELGIFNMGSTVIIAYPRELKEKLKNLKEGKPVQLGQSVEPKST